MTFTTKIEITFDRKSAAPDNDIQFYRVYRKKGGVPDRDSDELIMTVAQPFFPENPADDIIRLDSALPPQTGVTYDPLDQIVEIDPRGASYKIAIDDSLPIPPTNVYAIPDPADTSTDIGGILIGWTASASIGTIWGYDVTAVDSGALESPEGAVLDPLETSKEETIDIGLADGTTPVPSEYPQASLVFNTYKVDGGSSVLYVNAPNTSIIDDNGGAGWDTDGPKGVTGQSATSDFPATSITLKWNEALKNIGTDLSGLTFTVTAFTKAGYCNISSAVPGPNSVVAPITDGIAGVTLVKRDVTRWHDGVALKTSPPPPPENLIAPAVLNGIVNLNHGSIIRGSVFLTDVSGTIIYIEDSGTFASPNDDGDYVIDYSKINGTTDVGGCVKILSDGNISPGQNLNIQYKFGLHYGPGSGQPVISDPFIAPYDGTAWSGAGLQCYTDTAVDGESAYNYAWFVTDNAGRTTTGGETKYAQGILQDVEFPSAVTGFHVDPVLVP